MTKDKRRALKNAVKLAIAIHTFDFANGLLLRDGFSSEELEFIEQEAKRISIKLAGNHPMNFGSIQSCFQYFLSK